jgi:hypothetical protein
MDTEEALRFVEDLLRAQNKRLNDVQRDVFRGTWEGKTAKQINEDYRMFLSDRYIAGDVSSDLRKLLSEVLGEKVKKKTLKGAVERAKQRQELQPEESDTEKPPVLPVEPGGSALNTRQYWEEAPDISQFRGRDRELETLEEWIAGGCRLLTLYGIAGIGKTALSVKLANRIADRFQCLMWLQIKSSPSIAELLTKLIYFISQERDTSSDLSRLLDYFRNQPCLIVLDGMESVMQTGVHDGSYLPGCEEYSEMLRLMGTTVHQSVIILTTKQKPKEVEREEGKNSPVRSFFVRGLGESTAKAICTNKGNYATSDSDWRRLIKLYEGNPAALNLAATRVRKLYGGSITRFVERLQPGAIVFPDISNLLQPQFNCLSDLEQKLITYLANNHGKFTIADIPQEIVQSFSPLEELLQSLLRKSLIDSNETHLWLNSLVREYLISSPVA